LKIINYILSFSFAFIILSCKNEIKQDATSVETITNADTLAIVDTSTQKYPVWILEFQRLRQAVYQNDIAVIKSFFDFPLSEEQADGLLAVINYNTGKDLRKITKLLSEEEVMKYNKQIFRADFVKALLPMKK
jgi:site-specific recombinase XerD